MCNVAATDTPFYRYKRNCLLDLLLYVHGKHLRSCRDGQFLNNNVPGQAERGSLPVFSAIPSKETDDLLSLNQRMRERHFPRKMCRTRGSISGPLLTKRERYRLSYCTLNEIVHSFMIFLKIDCVRFIFCLVCTFGHTPLKTVFLLTYFLIHQLLKFLINTSNRLTSL